MGGPKCEKQTALIAATNAARPARNLLLVTGPPLTLASGDEAGAIEAAKRAIALNPKLAAQAAVDDDLKAVRGRL